MKALREKVIQGITFHVINRDGTAKKYSDFTMLPGGFPDNILVLVRAAHAKNCDNEDSRFIEPLSANSYQKQLFA